MTYNWNPHQDDPSLSLFCGTHTRLMGKCMISHLIPGQGILPEQVLTLKVTHNPAHLIAIELCFTGMCQVFIIIFPGLRRCKILKIFMELLHLGNTVKRQTVFKDKTCVSTTNIFLTEYCLYVPVFRACKSGQCLTPLTSSKSHR